MSDVLEGLESKISYAFLVALLVLFFAAVQNSIREIKVNEAAVVAPPAEFVGLSVDPRIIKRLLGLKVVIADLIWIDLMIKSDIAKAKEPFTPFYRTLKTIATLDPDNLFAYYVGGMYLSVITDDIRGATAILRDGAQHIESHPSLHEHRTAWKVFFLLGYNLIFEEGAIEEGSIWIRKAAEFERVPQFVKGLGNHVSTEAGRLEVGSRVLSDIYRRVSKPEEKAQVERKMLELAVKQELLDLNEKFQSWLRATGAFALPKPKAFQLFMRSLGHSKKDALGRPLAVDSFGKIKVN